MRRLSAMAEPSPTTTISDVWVEVSEQEIEPNEQTFSLWDLVSNPLSSYSSNHNYEQMPSYIDPLLSEKLA